MLNLNEIVKIANFKGLSLKNAEKEYLQDLILFSIYSKLGNELIFKGGTCLYKIYGINRFSEDLDFTLTNKINLKKFVSQIIMNFDLLGIKAKVKESVEYRNGINVKLLISGPLYKGDKKNQCFIPLNISKREKVILEPKKEMIRSLYGEVSIFQVFVMHEKEILAEKIRALFVRLKARDVYDIWFLLKGMKVVLDIQLINQKLSFYDLSFDKNKFIKRIESVRRVWKEDLKELIFGNLPDFDKVKKEIIEFLKTD